MGKSLKISKGDITESRSEAIVNAANNHLWMGSGVAGAIKRKGGISIEKEAVSRGPIEVGEAVATGAGNLHSKYVIHAAAMGQDLRTDERKIASATRKALLLADHLGLRSIDFPALGTGVGGFPLDKAAAVMIGEARRFLEESVSVEVVGFVLFDDEAFQIFRKELGEERLEI